ncbi:MAG: hypothetical protein BGO12_05090 [Verrucomicrobia bacterium 61-8]|jgi:hypothetical protein|nr:hypothetical protein [Verrucomicrobiota bacterium]OJV19416.1 MAG: hypothetical protein BGO12_05090 [Verrucomicrobia bacterium 61-8]
MNPFPEKILVPTTANRIPWTENAQAIMSRLLDFQINASAFLMDAGQLDDLKAEACENHFDRAFDDLFYQIPKELWWEVFPVKVELEETPETAPVSGGRTAAPRVTL